MKDYIKKYLSDVRSAFPSYGRNERRFMNDFKLNIYEYKSDHQECNIQDLVVKFGTPKEVVIDYFNNMNSEKYLSLMKKAFYIKAAMITALILMVVFFIMQTYSLHLVREEARKTIITSEDTTIIYE